MTARDIAAALTKAGLVGVDKKLVNSVLTIRATVASATTAPLIPTRSPTPMRSPPQLRSTAQRRGWRLIGMDALMAACRKLFADGKPRTAREIAAELTKQGMAGVDKSLVGSVLMREGKELFTYDRKTYTYLPR